MSNSLEDVYSPWHSGHSRMIPIYSGQDGCLNHWVSWNRGPIVIERPQWNQPALPPPTPGDNAIDVTEKKIDDPFVDDFGDGISDTSSYES